MKRSSVRVCYWINDLSSGLMFDSSPPLYICGAFLCLLFYALQQTTGLMVSDYPCDFFKSQSDIDAH